ncbi:MAG: hypothetical protein ACI9G1_001684 [Pirellulaceae bacterium]|jgi:hypothetical protein
MSDTNWDYVARRPRHTAVVDDKLKVRVREFLTDSFSSPGSAMATGYISDLSRDGAQLFVGSPLPKSSSLIIQVLDGDELLAELSAELQWSCRDSPEQLRSGIAFDKPLSHELLGELFLRGLLAS